jgi:hypothetical protein
MQRFYTISVAIVSTIQVFSTTDADRLFSGIVNVCSYNKIFYIGESYVLPPLQFQP